MTSTKERNTRKNIDWKVSVLERDEYKCKECGSKKLICVHHIIGWDIDKSLRFDINNGVVLCRGCHNKAHHSGNRYSVGRKPSEETKDKMRAAKIGKKLSSETKLKMREAQKMIIHSIERNLKISAAKKGVKFTEEHKRKLSAAKENYIPWNVGIPMSKEAKEKLKKVNKGKTWKLDPNTGKRLWFNL